MQNMIAIAEKNNDNVVKKKKRKETTEMGVSWSSGQGLGLPRQGFGVRF